MYLSSGLVGSRDGWALKGMRCFVEDNDKTKRIKYHYYLLGTSFDFMKKLEASHPSKIARTRLIPNTHLLRGTVWKNR